MKYPKRTIKWRDANSYPGWWDIDEIKPLNAESTGYVVKETKEFIVLALSVADNGQVGTVLSIPKIWIIK